MVLLEPDGTVLAVNNRREQWRHANPGDAIGKKLWDAPTLQSYPQHIAIMKKGISRAAKGHVFTTEVRMEREGLATATLDVSVQPVRDPEGTIIYLLFEARDITELKAAQEHFAEPEDGGAGPAHRRRRARFQQSADRRGQRPRPAVQADRGRQASPLRNQRPHCRRARRTPDRAIAGFQPGPAAGSTRDPHRAADREYAAPPPQRARAGH